MPEQCARSERSEPPGTLFRHSLGLKTLAKGWRGSPTFQNAASPLQTPGTQKACLTLALAVVPLTVALAVRMGRSLTVALTLAVANSQQTRT